MNLIEGIQREQKRLREVVIPAYISIGRAGIPALALIIEPALKASEKAIASGDVVEMMRAYQDMESIEV